jgi:hypothetical protein
MYLMGRAIEVIRSKGHAITEDEAEAVTIAILLHDIGHGPFSHSLEYSIVTGITHERLSELFMDRLNAQYNGRLSMAIQIFKGIYPKKFLHQLVSSQLDMDRLDYLKRDSFYTGVSEGVISSDRIIAMLDVHNDELAVEAKGIYSVEKFIIARRLMYWQVYLHKTVVSTENLLINILKRAKELASKGAELFATPSFQYFLQNEVNENNFNQNPQMLDLFAQLDDNDIMTSVKVWQEHPDFVLSQLCKNLVNRNLYKIEINEKPVQREQEATLLQKVMDTWKLTAHEASYFVFTEKLTNNAYNPANDRINILHKNNIVTDIAEAADQLNISALSTPVTKYCICFPKEFISL